MVGTLELEGRLQYARHGSVEIDCDLARVVSPAIPLIIIGGEPYWQFSGEPDPVPVPKWSRSQRATLPWENIEFIERIREGPQPWFAVHAGGDEAIARTNPLARRLAALRAGKRQFLLGTPFAFSIPASNRTPLLSELLEEWLREFSQTTRQASKVRMTVRRFIELNGNLPIDYYKRAHVFQFVRASMRLPKLSWRQGNRLTILELLDWAKEHPEVPFLKTETTNGSLFQLKRIFEYAVNLGHRDHNPADCLKQRVKPEEKTVRRPYDFSE